MNKDLFYNYQKILSYNATIYMINGGSSIGKTYGCKAQVLIKDFLKKGHRFAYIRRYKEEMKDCADFFTKVAVEFPGHEFSVKGRKFYIDDKLAGFGFVLSTQAFKKGSDFPGITNFLFDEFLIEGKLIHYLDDEIKRFLRLIDTIVRADDVRFRIFMLANAFTENNPYFLYYGITAKPGITKYQNGQVVVHIVDSSEFAKEREKTQFGQLIAGTEYGQQALQNKFFMDNEDFISKRSEKSRYYFTFAFEGTSYGVWYDSMIPRFYVSMSIDPCCKFVYALTLDDHRPNTLLFKQLKKALFFPQFLMAFDCGAVFYETQKIKGQCMRAIGMVRR